MNLDTAQRINTHLGELVRQANEVLHIANNSGDDVLKKRTQLVLATAIAEIDLQIWELVYRQFPELRPPEMIAVKGPSDV